jgi:hypothetical protein
MRKLIALWLASVAVVAVVTSALTAIYISRTTEQRTLQTAAALPWSMGVQSVQHGPNDSTDAKGGVTSPPERERPNEWSRRALLFYGSSRRGSFGTLLTSNGAVFFDRLRRGTAQPRRRAELERRAEATRADEMTESLSSKRLKHPCNSAIRQPNSVSGRDF